MPDYITRTELQRMVDACDPTTLAGKRDRLLLVVLRALTGRSGEVCGLRMSDAIAGSSGMTLWLPDGHMLIPAGEYTTDDPVILLTEWEGWLANSLGVIRYNRGQDGPLFRPVTKDNTLRRHGSLAPWAINQIVKRAAARAGLDNPERYTARAMRGPVRRKVTG